MTRIRFARTVVVSGTANMNVQSNGISQRTSYAALAVVQVIWHEIARRSPTLTELCLVRMALGNSDLTVARLSEAHRVVGDLSIQNSKI